MVGEVFFVLFAFWDGNQLHFAVAIEVFLHLGEQFAVATFGSFHNNEAVAPVIGFPGLQELRHKEYQSGVGRLWFIGIRFDELDPVLSLQICGNVSRLSHKDVCLEEAVPRTRFELDSLAEVLRRVLVVDKEAILLVNGY